MDFVPNQARKANFEYAMSNSFGFGGTNGALLFKRWSRIKLCIEEVQREFTHILSIPPTAT